MSLYVVASGQRLRTDPGLDGRRAAQNIKKRLEPNIIYIHTYVYLSLSLYIYIYTYTYTHTCYMYT